MNDRTSVAGIANKSKPKHLVFSFIASEEGVLREGRYKIIGVVNKMRDRYSNIVKHVKNGVLQS